MKMNKKTFDLIFNICRNYDPFTIYIENYRQEESAKKANAKYIEKLNEILSEYINEEIKYIPYGVDRSNKSDDAKKALIEWLNKKDIEVEKPAKKTWTAEDMKQILNKYDDQVGKALVKLYAYQTIDEQKDHETKEHNNVGFNGADAPILSSFAEFYQKRGFLSQKQLVIARKKIMKYANQLCNIVNQEV